MWPQWNPALLEPDRQALLEARRAMRIPATVNYVLENVSWDDGVPQEISNGYCVYVFELVEGLPEQVQEKYLALNNLGKRPRNNRVNSNCLYVGSSRGKIRSRLKEHSVGNCSDKIYALRLDKWFAGQGFRYRVHLRPFNVKSAALQIIEDAFARSLNPMFGKRGGNGN
jgi:hypothetical protein